MRQKTTKGTVPTTPRLKLISILVPILVLGFLLMASLTALPQPAAASAKPPSPAPEARLEIVGVNEAQLSIAKSVSEEPLLGGAIGFGVTVRNTANTGDPLEDDKAYNVSVTDTLPAGLTYTSASPAPTQIILNPNGSTTLVWTNIQDLEQQESTSLSIQATINPTITLGQALVNQAQTIANKAPDNSQAYITATTAITAYVQAIDVEKQIIQSTAVHQATGASGWELTAPGTGAGPQWPYTYEISVRNNNVSSTTNIMVTDVLPAGVAYLGPTTISPNPNGSIVTPTMVVQTDGSLLLTWNLGTLTTNEYTNPPIIRFGVAIPYRQRVQSLDGCIRVPDASNYQDPGCFTGAIIADGSTWNNSYDAGGIYSGTATYDGSTYTPQDDLVIPVTAKYQTIAKSGTPGVDEYTDHVSFTLHFYVSEYYTMTNVVITDVIPDGLSYIVGSASMTPTSVLTDTPAAGQTTIIWTIPSALTTPGRDGVITFGALQDTTYVQTGKPVVAFDSLTNIVSIGGNWQDNVDPTRIGTTTDGASASVQTRGPSIDKKVLVAPGVYVDGPITSTVGDIIEFRLSYVAPTRMDAKDNYLADFLPRGMSFMTQTQCTSSGTISNTFLTGDTDNTPCTYETYQLYGLNVVRWNYGFVSSGFTMTTFIRAHIDDIPEVADGVIVANFLKLSGVNTPGNAYSLRDMVNIDYHEPHLVLTKNVAPSMNLSAGDTITYGIAITNTGVVTAYNNIITDTVPQYVAVNTGSCTGSPTPALCVVLSGAPQVGAGGVISWTLIPTIAPSATQYLTYTAIITPGAVAGSSLTNTATVAYNSQPDNSGRPVTGTTNIADDNTDDATVTLSLPSIVKTASPSPVTIGDVVTFTLRVTVPIGEILPTAYITDILNIDGIRYNGAYTVAVSGAPLSPAALLATNVISSGTGITIGWSLGTIDNSNTTTQPYVFDLVFTTTVTGWNDAGTAWLNFPTATYNALNDASLKWIRASVAQSVASNQTTTVINQPLLSLKKTAQPNQNLIGGQTLTFTLAMTNVGASPAYNMVLTDALPSGIQVAASGGTGSPFAAAYSADSGAQAGTGGVLTFTTPVSLAVNSTQYFTFTAVISMPAVASTVLTNTSDVDWTSLPGSNPDARVYNDPTQESSWTSDTSQAPVSLAPITTAKTVLPATANNSTSIRIGDIVTYTIVNTIPPQIYGYTPYQNDYIDQGFEYIPNTFAFTANPALTTTLVTSGSAPANIAYGIVSGNNAGGANPNVGAYKTNTQQQAIEWWMTNYFNSTAVTQTITFTLQAQFTGVGLAGGVVLAAPNVTTASRANSERLYWDASNGGVYTTTGALSTALATATTYVGQPNLALNKTAQTPAAGAYVAANQHITYTLVITNNGHAPAYDVVLTETLPLSTTFVSVAIVGANYPATTPIFTTTLTSAPSVGSTGVITLGLDQVLGLGNTPGIDSGNNTTAKVVTMTFVVLTDPGLGANLTLTNTARVSYYDSQPGAGTDADANGTTPSQRTYGATTPVNVTQRTVTPTILKTESPITATIGQPIVYTIQVPQTPLTVTLYNVSFTDSISSGLRLDAASVSGGVGSNLLTSGNNLTVTWTSILSNTQASVVISATVLDIGSNVAGRVITNTSSMVYASIPGGAYNPAISSTVTLTETEPQLTISKKVATSRSPVGASDIVTYTIVVTNNIFGPINTSPAYDLIISDTLPDGIAFLSTVLITDTRPVTATLGGTYPSWTASQLDYNGVLTLTFTAQVDPSIGAGVVLTNSTRALYSSRPGAVTDERSYTTTIATAVITTAAPAGLTKAVSPITPTIGQPIVYTVTLPTPALIDTLYDVRFSDAVSTGLRVDAVSFSGGIGGTNNTITNSVAITWTSIPSNTQATVVISATVLDIGGNVAGRVVTNTASFTYAKAPGLAQSTPLMATVTLTETEPQLTISKNVATSRSPVGASDIVTYTVVVTNVGFGANSSPAFDLSITDTLPLSVTFASTVSITDTNPVTAAFGGTYPIWTADQINPGGVVTLTYTAQVDPNIGAGVVLTNSTRAFYSSRPGAVSDERSYTTTIATAVITTAMPSGLTKAVTPSTATIGQVVTYTVVLPTPPLIDTLYDVFFTDVVSTSLSVTGVSYSLPATNNSVANNVWLAFSTVPSNTQAVITITAYVRDILANVNGVVVPNTATFGSASTPGGTRLSPLTSNTVNVTLIEPSLTITKTTTPNKAAATDTVTMSFQVKNVGTSIAYDVVVTDPLPSLYFTNISEETTPAGFTFGTLASPPNTIVTYNGGNISVGQTITYAFTAKLTSNVIPGNVLTNFVTVTQYTTLPGSDPNERYEPSVSASAPLTVTVPDIVITKTDGQTTVVPGQTLTYTLSVTNAGQGNATGVVVTETVPSFTRFNAPASLPTLWSCADNSTAGTVCTNSIGSMAAGATTTLRFAVTISNPVPAAAGVITNTAVAWDDGTHGADPTPGNNTTTDIDTLNATPDLVIGKTDSVTSATPGDVLAYTISYTNAGNQGATGVAITETIPDNTTYVGSGWSNVSGQTYTRNIGSLGAGITGTVQITVHVSNTVPAGVAAITNTAIIADDGTNGPDPTPSNNTTTDIDTLNAAPDLVIGKTDGVTTATPGDTLTYTISYTNAGNQDATGVVITETIPGNTTYIGSGWSIVSTQVYTLTIGNLAAGAAGTVQITVHVSNTVPAGVISITNTAVIADDGANGADPTPSDNTTTDIDTLTAAPDLVIGKTDGVTTAVPGQTLTYTISYTNAGNKGATGVVITETIPDNTTYVGSSWSNVSSQTFTRSIGSLGAGITGTVQITVLVNSSLPAGVMAITNTALIADDGTNGADPTPSNNTTQDIDTLTAAPDLVIGKTDGVTTTTPGSTLVYTISYTNAGNQGATGVAITETIPDNTTYIGSGWTNVSGQSFTRSIGSPGAGVTGTVQITVQVNITVPAGITAITNAAVIADDGTNGPDPTPSNNTTQDIDTLTAAPDLVIGKTDGVTTTTPGSTLVYTISYTNAGNQGATGVVITETIPDNTTYFGSGWNTVSAQVYTLAIGNLAAGAAGTMQITVHVSNTVPASVMAITNTAVIADDGTNGPDPTPSDNTTQDIDTLDATPDLAVTKTDNGITGIPGGFITYTINYTNTGDQDATGVVLTETIPDSTSYVGYAWTLNSGRSYTYNVGPMAASASGQITIVVKVTDTLPAGVAIVTNTVRIGDDGSNGSDPTPDNNWDQEPTPVLVIVDLRITKTDGGNTTTPGSALVYTLTYTNAGNVGVAGVFITETVPAYTIYNLPASQPTPWSCADGSVAGTTCVRYAGTLQAGGTGTVTFALTVTTPLPAGVHSITNTVRISDDGKLGPDATPENNVYTETTPIKTTPDLQITKTDGGITTTVGAALTYTLNFTNVGDIGVTGVVLTETIPANTALYTPSLWTCVPNNNTGSTCTLNTGSLAVGVSNSTTFVLSVSSPLSSSVKIITNTVTIGDDGTNGPDGHPSDNTSSDTTPVLGAPDLAITKTDDGLSTTPNGTVVYTLNYTNVGNIGVTNVNISETVPTATRFNASSSLPTVWTCNDNPNNNPQGSICSLSVGALEPGQSGAAYFAVTVYYPLPPSVPQVLNRTAISDDGTHGPDAHPENNTAEDTTPIVRAIDLHITKTSTSTVIPGDIISWTLYYSNTGNVAAANTIITETVPNNTRYAAAANTTPWSCADGSISGTICAVNVGTVPGLTGTGHVAFAVRVENPLPASVTTISNTVRILDDGRNGPDPTPPNNVSSATLPILRDATTAFTKTAWHDPVTPGWASQRYNIFVHNTGTTTITNMIITDVIPVSTQYLESTIPVTSSTNADPPTSWYAPGGSWDGFRTVTWNVGDVPPGWWVIVKIRIRVYSSVPVGSTLVNAAFMSASSGATSMVTNSVRVIGFPATPTPTATATATPTPVGGLCGPEAIVRVNAGGTITYTDSTGNLWLPDQKWITGTTSWGYTGSNYTYTNSTPISGTLDQSLYQTERWWTADGGYQFDVANGYYRVALKFAEIYPYMSANSRVFGVRVEGATVLPHFDVIKAAGKFAAYDVVIDTRVSDGRLNIDFMRDIGTPAIQAIAVYAMLPCGSATPGASPTQRPTDTPTATIPPARTGTATATRTSTPTPTPTTTAGVTSLMVNAGGQAYTDSVGQPWKADQMYTNGGWGYVGGEVYTTATGTNGTTDDPLYQSQRYWPSNGAYKFTLPNGTYNVQLRLAEIYQWTARGGRVFDIRIENAIVRSGIDVVTTVGLNAPLDITITAVTVTDGVLDLEFLARKGPPIINAISITQ